MPGVYVGVGCSFVKANKVFVGVGCSYVEVNKVYTAENCNWKVVHEAGGKGLIALVGAGGASGAGLDVSWSSYRSIVALSDDTVAFAVNETGAKTTTLIKIDSKGNSVWQRQSDRFQTSITWENKHTNALVKDSGDNIYQLGRAAQPSSFKGVEWIQKITSSGTYQWDRTTALDNLTSGFGVGMPGTNEVYYAAFNGPDGDEESSMQVEAQTDRSQGHGNQEFLTGVSTFDTSDGSLDSFRVNGSSGGTGDNNGNNYGREIVRLGDKIYSASQFPGHKCAHANGPCYHVANIYRRSLDGTSVDSNGGGRVEVNSTSYPIASTGSVFTNNDESYSRPILATYFQYTQKYPAPGAKNYFFFYKPDLDLTDILKYELTGPATDTTNLELSHIGGSGTIWDSSNNHIYFLQGHKDFNELSIIQFDVATGTIQNQNRFRITNSNDRLFNDTTNPAALAMSSDKFYIQGHTNRFDDTGVVKANQTYVLQVPKDLTKGFGDYGDNLVYEPRPANDLYTLSSSTANLGYSGPGGSYYWPIPGTRTHGTQDENTTPTTDNIPVGITKQKD